MAIHFPSVEWSKKAVVYEVNIRQYTAEGNFAAFAKHLPRLKSMGVDILWLMPITPIATKGRLGTLGSYYACSSYVKINPEFGTLADFKSLVQQAHELGMKVIIDWVANHTGLNHEWTIDNPDFYVRDAKGNFTERNGWQDVIDLNYANPQMREAMMVAMQFWINECKIDGFRCDMAHLVPLNFWKDARRRCDALRQLYWLAECEENEYHTVFDTTYAWNWMHTTEKMMKNQASVNDMMQVLHSYTQIGPDTGKLFFTANHDENSWNGTEYDKYGAAAAAFAIFTFLWKGMPLIYSGQELPNRKKLEFFNKDVINWQPEARLHSFYAVLSNVHKTNAVAFGETFILPVQQPMVLAFVRKYETQVVLVILNFSANDRIKLQVQYEHLAGTYRNAFSELTFDFKNVENFEVSANGYLVYEKMV